MIEINEAINIITNNSTLLKEKEMDIIDVLNHCLSEDIFSPMFLPPFDQSAMDGYAVCGEFETYKLVGEVQAGDAVSFRINKGEACRIFTGAITPEGTTAIAKQEIVKRNNNEIRILEKVKEGTSIRRKGEELEKGALVIKKSTLLTPAAIGLLSGLGLEKVKVISQPKITVIVTGNELTPLGQELKEGKIYESNSYTLRSVLQSVGYNSEVLRVKDDFEDTKRVISNAIEKSDVVIMTGGISVGDYDFVGKALESLGVEQAFYKVNQKPGKPIFYGTKDKVKIFGLPGNPAAVLTCFYMYVVPAIRKMTGYSNPLLEKREVMLGHDYVKKGTRSYILKAKVKNGQVKIHSGQSSAMLSSFVDANCLLLIDSEEGTLKAGEKVTVYMLP
ncbi:MAG: molybdopterin molybdotransferase MoeA [Fluviicola sp.]|nr:molybdopterin molybdotransferase MoeA [Fluviicola sp.]